MDQDENQVFVFIGVVGVRKEMLDAQVMPDLTLGAVPSPEVGAPSCAITLKGMYRLWPDVLKFFVEGPPGYLCKIQASTFAPKGCECYTFSKRITMTTRHLQEDFKAYSEQFWSIQDDHRSLIIPRATCFKYRPPNDLSFDDGFEYLTGSGTTTTLTFNVTVFRADAQCDADPKAATFITVSKYDPQGSPRGSLSKQEGQEAKGGGGASGLDQTQPKECRGSKSCLKVSQSVSTQTPGSILGKRIGDKLNLHWIFQDEEISSKPGQELPPQPINHETDDSDKGSLLQGNPCHKDLEEGFNAATEALPETAVTGAVQGVDKLPEALKLDTTVQDLDADVKPDDDAPSEDVAIEQIHQGRTLIAVPKPEANDALPGDLTTQELKTTSVIVLEKSAQSKVPENVGEPSQHETSEDDSKASWTRLYKRASNPNRSDVCLSLARKRRWFKWSDRDRNGASSEISKESLLLLDGSNGLGKDSLASELATPGGDELFQGARCRSKTKLMLGGLDRVIEKLNETAKTFDCDTHRT